MGVEHSPIFLNRLTMHQLTLDRAVTKAWRQGFCAVTRRQQSCYGSKGFWKLNPQQTQNFSAAASACLALCIHCSNCVHISVSLHRKECSWFLHCEPGKLQHSYDFRTHSTQKRSLADRSSGPPMAGTWHSQYGQDREVAALLGCKRRGYFVDLAANDPVHFSNTLALERDFGWRGLCIEPQPSYHERLRSLRSCTLVPHAVSDRAGQVVLSLPSAKTHNGLDARGFAGIRGVANRGGVAARPHTSLSVTAQTFKDILRHYSAPPRIDFLSLDVEGAEDLVMASFPWGEWNISVLTVEEPSEALQVQLRSTNYVFHRYEPGSRHRDQMWVHANTFTDGRAYWVGRKRIAPPDRQC